MKEILKRLDELERRSKSETKNTDLLRELSDLYRQARKKERDPAKKRMWLTKKTAADEKIAALKPRADDAQARLATDYSLMANMESDVSPAKAKDWIEKCLKIRKRLAARDPDNLDLQRTLATTYESMAEIEDLLTRIDKGLQCREESLKLRRKLAEDNPDEEHLMVELAKTMAELAGSVDDSDPARGRALYEESISIYERLVEQEPDDSDYRAELAELYSSLGMWEEEHHPTEPEKARSCFEKSLSFCRAALDDDPDHDDLREAYGTSLWFLSRLDAKQDPGKALDLLYESLKIREKLSSEDRTDPYRQWRVCDAVSDITKCLKKLDRADDAMTWAQRYAKEAERLIKLLPKAPSVRQHLACAQVELGLLDEALETLAVSARMGAINPEDLETDETYDPIRSDSRFVGIVEKMRENERNHK